MGLENKVRWAKSCDFAWWYAQMLSRRFACCQEQYCAKVKSSPWLQANIAWCQVKLLGIGTRYLKGWNFILLLLALVLQEGCTLDARVPQKCLHKLVFGMSCVCVMRHDVASEVREGSQEAVLDLKLFSLSSWLFWAKAWPSETLPWPLRLCHMTDAWCLKNQFLMTFLWNPCK